MKRTLRAERRLRLHLRGDSPYDAADASQQGSGVADEFRPTVPKLAALMNTAETGVLAHKTFPTQNHSKIHSTNPLERLNGEI